MLKKRLRHHAPFPRGHSHIHTKKRLTTKPIVLTGPCSDEQKKTFLIEMARGGMKGMNGLTRVEWKKGRRIPTTTTTVT
ncbi:Protein CBG26333 [Caenorhabditis briggsae]|uniref:Protein CBG26333 n=1 Tax=Caenorhabditis briggsae TaxID=6238 RepID=B6IGA5_CAEBR|nr:Protein CBG26333 [Caenorhabditis briggsae]CAR98935.1 Protein CBG26333 [Caenorhabditis briggsae]